LKYTVSFFNFKGSRVETKALGLKPGAFKLLGQRVHSPTTAGSGSTAQRGCSTRTAVRRAAQVDPFESKGFEFETSSFFQLIGSRVETNQALSSHGYGWVSWISLDRLEG
jgi:hypothetical protein